MSKTYNEALLQRVEEYLASSGLSQNKMAQAVGLSQTALSNWRRKIYNGDPAYVEGKLKEYFETQAAREAVEEQAAPYLSDTGYVPTTVSEDIYKGIKFAQLERGMVVLHGDAGIGKTEGARKFLHDYPHNTVFITATPTTGSLNCINDLKMLRKQYTCTSKRDYLKLLDLLVDKYSVEETAAVHAALLKKVQAGDLDAIRLWNEMSKENRDAGEGVQIIDDIKVK